MKHFGPLLNFAGLSILLIGLGACSLLSPVPDRSRFFLLTPLSQAGAGSQPGHDSTSGLALGLGPIKLPAYLDRTEVVTRVEPNRLEVSENNHWAEPLKTNFSRVLAENLTTLLGTEQIVSFPWYSSTHLDYQITVDVDRFETDSQGNAQLTALWTIENPKTGKNLDQGESNLSTSGGGDASQSAQALSHVLGDFSRQIATAIRQINNQHHLR
jgi:uncharacterized lipoprotein YmbA